MVDHQKVQLIWNSLSKPDLILLNFMVFCFPGSLIDLQVGTNLEPTGTNWELTRSKNKSMFSTKTLDSKDPN